MKFPDEGAEFTGDGDDAFAVADSAGPEVAVAFTQAFLHAPGEGFDFVGLTVLALGECGADFGLPSVGLS